MKRKAQRTRAELRAECLERSQTRQVFARCARWCHCEECLGCMARLKLSSSAMTQFVIGNTAARALLTPQEAARIQASPTREPISLLYVGVGDVRNPLTSLRAIPRPWKDTGGATGVELHLNDLNAVTIARDLVLLHLMSTKGMSVHTVASLWSDALVEEDTNRCLSEALVALTCTTSPLPLWLSFGDDATLRAVNTVLRTWRSLPCCDLGREDAEGSALTAGQLRALRDDTLRRAGVGHGRAGASQFWRTHGVATATERNISAYRVPNRTLVYPIRGQGARGGGSALAYLDVQGPMGAFATLDRIPVGTPEFVEALEQGYWSPLMRCFRSWSRRRAVHVTVWVGDCLTKLRCWRGGEECKLRPSAAMRHKLRRRVAEEACSALLHSTTMVTSGAPLRAQRFHAIDTSNLIDYLGLYNILATCSVLLHDAPSQVGAPIAFVHTESILGMADRLAHWYHQECPYDPLAHEVLLSCLNMQGASPPEELGSSQAREKVVRARWSWRVAAKTMARVSQGGPLAVPVAISEGQDQDRAFANQVARSLRDGSGSGRSLGYSSSLGGVASEGDDDLMERGEAFTTLRDLHSGGEGGAGEAAFRAIVVACDDANLSTPMLRDLADAVTAHAASHGSSSSSSSSSSSRPPPSAPPSDRLLRCTLKCIQGATSEPAKWGRGKTRGTRSGESSFQFALKRACEVLVTPAMMSEEMITHTYAPLELCYAWPISTPRTFVEVFCLAYARRPDRRPELRAVLEDLLCLRDLPGCSSGDLGPRQPRSSLRVLALMVEFWRHAYFTPFLDAESMSSSLPSLLQALTVHEVQCTVEPVGDASELRTFRGGVFEPALTVALVPSQKQAARIMSLASAPHSAREKLYGVVMGLGCHRVQFFDNLCFDPVRLRLKFWVPKIEATEPWMAQLPSVELFEFAIVLDVQSMSPVTKPIALCGIWSRGSDEAGW